MMHGDELWDGLVPEDRMAAAMDMLLYGNVITTKGEDGRLHRVPPAEWPHGIRPDLEHLTQVWRHSDR